MATQGGPLDVGASAERMEQPWMVGGMCVVTRRSHSSGFLESRLKWSFVVGCQSVRYEF